MGRLAALALIVLLGACARIIPGETRSTPSTRPVSQSPASAIAAGLHAGPAVEKLGMTSGGARIALLSFVESCPRLLARNDASGLTRPADWQLACEAARRWNGDAHGFFATYFETVKVGPGEAFATGYFEPEIDGVRQRQPGYDVPVYGMPADLVRHEMLLTDRPVPDEVLVEIVDELFLPLVRARSRNQREKKAPHA